MINNIADKLLVKMNDDSVDTLTTLEEIVATSVKLEKVGFGFILFTFSDGSVIRAPDIWELLDIPM
jgi:hypothetical protein